MRASYWSLQKNGTAWYGRGLAAGRRHQQVAGGGGALLGGVRPVLEPHLLAEEAVVPAHDVAGGEHAGRPGGEAGVGHHPVADLQAAAGQPVGHRCHPDADDDDVGVDHGAVGEPDALDPVLALDGGHADAEAHVDAAVSVQVGEHAADLHAEGALERRRQCLHHRDLEAQAPGRSRHLGADEAGADHHDPPGGGVEGRPQRQRVVQRA